VIDIFNDEPLGTPKACRSAYGRRLDWLKLLGSRLLKLMKYRS